MTKLIIERASLPADLLQWLEAGDKQKGTLTFREEQGKIVLERFDDVDPELLARVYANVEQYHSALERLADS